MVSMKEFSDFSIMRHDVSRYILRPSHNLIKSSEQLMKIKLLTKDDSSLKEIDLAIHYNQQEYLKNLEMAFLFDERNKNELIEEPLMVNLKIWIKEANKFNLHYTDIIAHALKINRHLPFNEIIDDNMRKETIREDLLILLKKCITTFSFVSIAYILNQLKNHDNSFLDELKHEFSVYASSQKNFFNLLLASYEENEVRNTIISYLTIENINFKELVLLQNSRKNSNDIYKDYETNRFIQRFTPLFESGIFDNDIVLKNQLKEIPLPGTESNSVSFIYHKLNYENDKRAFFNLVQERIQQIKD